MASTANIIARDNITNDSFFITKPDCPLNCGNVTVPYPFGFKSGCYINDHLNLTCNYTFDPPKLRLGGLEVSSISQTQVRVRNSVAVRCYNETRATNYTEPRWVKLAEGRTFSATANKFTVVGCNVFALISWRHEDRDFSTGCLSVCSENAEVLPGNCTGIGCCQIDIPKGLKNFNATATLSRVSSETKTEVSSTCNYAFLGEQNRFEFEGESDFKYSPREFEKRIRRNVPLIIDFVIANQSCSEARNSSTLECRGDDNTSFSCHDSESDYGGYFCICNQGYKGNPYLNSGCTDINECLNPTLNNCHEKAKCTNTAGSFNCTCPDHYYGDGRKDRDGSTGCVREASQSSGIKLSLDHRAITKTQQSLSVEAHVDVLLSQSCRDAPTLLGYEPSYKGKLRRRGKEVLPSTGGQGRGKKAKTTGSKPPRVKLPTFRKPAEFWFGEGDHTERLEANIPPLTLASEHANEMGRRNVVRVNIRDGKAVQKDTVLAMPAEKRQKVTHDLFPTTSPTTRPGPLERTESSAAGGSRPALLSLGSADAVAAQEFAPSFALTDGRVVTVEDSVKVEPQLAAAMLQGLALPKDMQKIPEGLQPSLIHAAAHLVQAGQALLRSSKDAELVVAERARFHEDLKVEREKVRSYRGSLKMAKAQIAELEKERDEMESKLKKAEQEVAKVLRREKRKMKEVDGAAYQAGFDRAGAEYIRDARSMVNDAILMRVPIAYRTGYKDGVRAVCVVVQPGAEADLMKSIPAPETPELVLPYTEEECAPLPPEEFPESEDEVEDLTLAVADDDAGGGKVTDKAAEVADPGAAQAEGDLRMVDKDAEAEANASAPRVDANLAEAVADADGSAQV